MRLRGALNQARLLEAIGSRLTTVTSTYISKTAILSGQLRFMSGTSSVFSREETIKKYQEQLKDDYKKIAELNGMHGERGYEDAKNDQLIKYNDPLHLSQGMDRLRVVPKERAFYMLNPPHEEQIRVFNDLIQKYISLPLVAKEKFQAPGVMPQEEYATNHGGHRLKPSQYLKFKKLALRLAQIEPQIMPEEVNAALLPFLRRSSQDSNLKTYKTLDSEGRAIAVGRRKTSSAKVQLVKSQDDIRGQILVNGRPLDRYFPRLQDRNEIMYPLKVIQGLGEYNIFATVQGGGLSGQAGAISHALSRSLIIHNPLLLTRLSKAGCIQRDPRNRERKKPGKPRARKSYTWVKR